MSDNTPILEVKNLKKYFKTSKGMLHAVDNISFDISEGRTLGLVGESGCGKSTTGRAILRLVEPTSGEVLFRGESILTLNKVDMRKKRTEMQIIFQDPFSSLNPRKSVAQTIEEALIRAGRIKGRAEMQDKVLELMTTVGLAERLSTAYPHELDGGRRQRVGIARALAMDPSFIVCDEPVSALDVSIQAQILNLMKQIQNQNGIAYLFITHNLSVVRHFSDDIAVMYLGQIIEKAPAGELFANPVHPYTQALLSAIPLPKLGRAKDRIILKGEITSPVEPKKCCRFAPRCIHAGENCFCQEPEVTDVGHGHTVSCFLAE